MVGVPMGGADPTYVVAESVDEWSLEKITGLVAPMSAGQSGELEGGWSGLAGKSQQRISDFVTGLTAKVGQHWTGQAATAATDRLGNDYRPCADSAAEGFNGVMRTLTQLADAVQTVRDTVPESVDLGAWDTLTPWDTDKEDKYYEERGHARAVMRTFLGHLESADRSVPAFAEIGELGDNSPLIGGPSGYGGPNASGPSAGGPNAASPFAVGGNPGVDPGDESTIGTPTSSSDAADASGRSTDSGSGLSQSDSALADAVNSSATSPASVDATSPAGFGGPVGLGGSHGGLGGGGGGGGGMAPTAGTLSGMALSGAAAGGTSGASGGVGRVGNGGFGGMAGAPGARGKGEDDKEHRSPGYLVTIDNGNELIGRMPLTAPPVIGA